VAVQVSRVLISTTLLIVGSIKLWQQTPSIGALQAEVVRLENQLRKGYNKINFRTLKYNLGKPCTEVFPTQKRISLYRHNGKHFTMIAHSQKNPNYTVERASNLSDSKKDV